MDTTLGILTYSLRETTDFFGNILFINTNTRYLRLMYTYVPTPDRIEL